MTATANQQTPVNASALAFDRKQQQQQQQQDAENRQHANYFGLPPESIKSGDCPSSMTVLPLHQVEVVKSLQKHEHAVLRDCLYALQGMNGQCLHWYTDTTTKESSNVLLCSSPALPLVPSSSSSTGTVQNVSPPIPPILQHLSSLQSGAMDCLQQCAQAGWLYRQTQSVIDIVLGRKPPPPPPSSSQTAPSSIARALALALEDLELVPYRSFLAQLEAELQKKTPQDHDDDDNVTAPTFTLRSLYVALQPFLCRLKTVAMIATAVLRQEGPAILTALQQHVQLHGGQRHCELVQNLLEAAAVPWLQQIEAWITQGTLSSVSTTLPYSMTYPSSDVRSYGSAPRGHHLIVSDFFVMDKQQDASHSLDRSIGKKTIVDDDKYLWQHRYAMDASKVPNVPTMLEPDLVEPIFLIGKGINYIRLCLGEEYHADDDTTETSPTRQAITKEVTHRGSPLRARVEEAASRVHSQILGSLNQDHSMMEHLFALKQFLLLGQGDFFSALMDGLHSEYGTHPGIVGIYRHSLEVIAETAIRSSNANEFPPEILGRLQVELRLDANDSAKFMFGVGRNDTAKSDQAKDTRTVWDIFSLEYTLPDPLFAIVPPETMHLYHKMFLFLFDLRRVEFLLNHTWRQSAVLQHALHTFAQHNAINVTTSATYSQAIVLLRQISMTRQAMMHFVTNLKSYLMFEILEGGWKQLVQDIGKAKTLDSIIQAHDDYINGICRRSLFESQDDGLGKQIQRLLALSNEFCDYQIHLFDEALQAADRASEKRKQAEVRMTQGDWGFESEADVLEEETFFGLSDSFKLQDLDKLSAGFNDQVLRFLRTLDKRLNGSTMLTGQEQETTPASMGQASHKSSVERDDLDSLRFLSFQLDHNSFYESQDS